MLLLLAVGVLFCGVALLFVSAAPEGRTAKAIMLNAATAGQLATVLRVPRDVAEAVIAKRPVGGFGDVDAVKRLRDAGGRPLVPDANYRAARDRLIVRSFADAKAALWFWGVGMAALFLLAHIALWVVLPRADPFFLPVAAILSFLSVLMLFAIKDPLRDRMTFASQAQGVVFGGATLFFVVIPILSRAKLHRYTYIYALAAVIASLLLLLGGTDTGGVRLSVAGVQPIEAVKVLLVLFLAAFVAERGAELDDPLRKGIPRAKDFLPLGVMFFLTLGLFAIVRDLGPVLLLFGVFVITLYLVTGRILYVATGVALLVLGGWAGYQIKSSVFPTRLDMWLSPWSNAHTQGDHLALGLWGLASGGSLGSGLGMGLARTIPRAGSDLAFASVGEEMGIAGTLAVVACFLVLVARGFVLARGATTVFDRYLAYGLSTLFGLQTLLIVSGTLGLFPLSGVTLPFVSAGKSSLTASLFAAGMLIYLSGKRGTDTVPLPVGRNFVSPETPEQARAARGVGVFFFALLGLVCAGRLVYIQMLASDFMAAQTVTVPGADGKMYAHTNPRLRLLAARIKRGRILDRAQKPLAFTNADGVRVYPLGAAATHTVGFMEGGRGLTGIERRYDRRLRGYDTLSSLLPLWRTKNAPGFKLPQGETITLALSADLQKAAADALKASGKRRGAAVVLDARTGGVLAAASIPTFDPNTVTPAQMAAMNRNESGNFPLINRAVNGYYPPGSTFKIVTASALLGGSDAGFTTDCAHATSLSWTAGNTRYSRRRIADDEGERGHGSIGLRGAIVDSCNVYFARAGIRLGAKVLREQAAQFGFAKLPTAPQFDAALPEIAFGQGEMLASPLEIAGVAGLVASGGKRFEPTWEKGKPGKTTEVMMPDVASQLADAMAGVTQTGTAAGRFSGLPFAVAGKTGTAQNDQFDKCSHGWFAGFAPVNEPKVAFAVLIENGGYGAQSAVPVARRILERLPGD